MGSIGSLGDSFQGLGNLFVSTIRFFTTGLGYLRLSFIRRSNLGPKFRRAAAVHLAPRLRENIRVLNKQTGSQPLQPFSRRRTDCSEYFMAPDHDITLMLTSRLDVRAAASASLRRRGFGRVSWVVVFPSKIKKSMA